MQGYEGFELAHSCTEITLESCASMADAESTCGVVFTLNQKYDTTCSGNIRHYCTCTRQITLHTSPYVSWFPFKTEFPSIYPEVDTYVLHRFDVVITGASMLNYLNGKWVQSTDELCYNRPVYVHESTGQYLR